MLIGKTFEIHGIVQGVGFRPTMHRLAVRMGLVGWVKNCSGKVLLHLAGEKEIINRFIETLPDNLPPQAKIDSITTIEENIKIEIEEDFKILESDSSDPLEITIPADIAICSECQKDLADKTNRRYEYPFTTCADCGPRYTVVNAMPYDRKRTTMNKFPLCRACQKEYSSPEDRRFHAESIACPKCGPQVFAESFNGRKLETKNPIGLIRKKLLNGEIAAIRGIGGFQLAADAFNPETLKTLRERKLRPHKPFAVMADSIETLKRYCKVSDDEEKLLKSPQAPIVILDLLEGTILPADLLTPDNKTLGAMLPASPMHILLFQEGISMLVMTSGNMRGEPICISNQEARERLKDICDVFLFHDREINLRNDDSLTIIQNGFPQIWRRARGYAPNAIGLPFNLKRNVLAMGAELKNTVALAYENKAVISPHIGDLETPEAIDGMKQVADCLPEFIAKTPEAIAVDLHPDMHSTACGKALAEKYNIPVIEVQHHYAHALSCMSENGLESALALVFDGTGFGTDGKIWGSELLLATPEGFDRIASFEAVPLPGGDAATLNPARQLTARLFKAGMEFSSLENASEKEVEIWKLQCEKNLNAPESHAAGRVFDAFSAMLGLAPNKISYEGQAAIRLEAEAWKHKDKKVRKKNIAKFKTKRKNKFLTIDWSPAFAQFFQKDLSSDKAEIAMGFHMAMAEAAKKMLEYGMAKTPERNLVISGGVFMNRLLNELLFLKAEELGLKLHIQQKVPPNDGGISLGQAVAAGCRDI